MGFIKKISSWHNIKQLIVHIKKTMEKCDFCQPEILNQQYLFISKHTIIIYPKNPVIKEHFLLIPKRHVVFVHDLKPTEQKERNKFTS